MLSRGMPFAKVLSTSKLEFSPDGIVFVVTKVVDGNIFIMINIFKVIFSESDPYNLQYIHTHFPVQHSPHSEVEAPSALHMATHFSSIALHILLLAV